MKHPTDEQLVQQCRESAAKGRRRTPAEAAVRTHLERGCPQCRRRMREFAFLLDALEGTRLVAPPAEADRRAHEWIAHRLTATGAKARALKPAAAVRSAARRVKQVLEEVAATLVLDSYATPALAGIRGGRRSGPRSLLYRSKLGSLHVQVTPAEESLLRIRGQFIPAESGLGVSGRVVLESEGISASRSLSPTGEFRVPLVPARPVRLRVEWNGRVIIVEFNPA